MVSLMSFQSFRNYQGSQEILYHSLCSLHVFQHKIWLKNKELILFNAKQFVLFCKAPAEVLALEVPQSKSIHASIHCASGKNGYSLRHIHKSYFHYSATPPKTSIVQLIFFMPLRRLQGTKLGEMKESSTLPVGFGKYQERGEAGV